jgi:hypothetical protein
MVKNIFNQIIHINGNRNGDGKYFKAGFSLSKFSNTKPVPYITVFAGCLNPNKGSLKRIIKFKNNNTEKESSEKESTKNESIVFSINNWSIINPITEGFGNWFNIVCSKSGQYVVSTNSNYYHPSIYVSNNYGTSFTENLYNDEKHNYSNLAINYNGNYILCTAIRDDIFNSTDYGETIGNTNNPGGFWWAIGMNSSGSIACIAKNFNNSGGQTANLIYISINQSLFNISLNNLFYSWSSVAMNSNGNFIIVCSYEGYVYYTTNTGNSWKKYNLPTYCWSSITMTSNGTYIAICSLDGYIYISLNSGKNWSSCSPNNNLNWSCIYLSKDSNLLLATAINDNIYYSSNYGSNWSMTSPNGIKSNWSSICCSNNGKYIYACINGGNIYTTTTSS